MKSFSLRGWLPFFLVLTMLAGCRSEQVAFDFGSHPGYSHPATESAPAAQLIAQPAPPADFMTPSLMAPQVPQQPTPRHQPIATQPQLPQATTKAAQRVLQQLAPLKRTGHSAAAHPTENGLKNIFFFALGVVLLVLAGLAWAVAAIFGIGFWAALGYVAAGIVVLLLLRSLVRRLAGKR